MDMHDVEFACRELGERSAQSTKGHDAILRVSRYRSGRHAAYRRIGGLMRLGPAISGCHQHHFVPQRDQVAAKGFYRSGNTVDSRKEDVGDLEDAHGGCAYATLANASRVRFSGCVEVVTTLSSIRMPPKGLSSSTTDQSIWVRRESACAAASKESIM